MSSNPLDENCPECDADVTFGRAHTFWIYADEPQKIPHLNCCPECNFAWEPKTNVKDVRT